MGVSNRLSRGLWLVVAAAVTAVGMGACGSESTGPGTGGNAGSGGTPTTATTSTANGGNGGTAGAGPCGEIEQTVGDCKNNVCEDGEIVALPDDTDLPNDDNECTFDSCFDGAVMNTPAPSGFVCTQGGKACDGEGACVACVKNEDCLAGEEVCNAANECVAASCGDGVKNNDETGVDCGGSCGATCIPGEACEDAADCLHGVCKQNTCLVPTCGDGVKNGTETDVDCGGSCSAGFNPKKCAPDQGCMVDADCKGNECSGTTCVPNCSDGVLNNGEVATDCGGPSCGGCPDGESCTAGGDCASGFCVSDVCCDTACDQECQACSASTKASGPDGICGPSSVGTVCGPTPSCENGEQTAQNACDATGACVDNGPTSCAPYLCGATTCLTTCAGDQDCAAPAVCTMGACTQPIGGACATNANCATGFCADGVCCDTACTESCKACSAAKNGDVDGTCGNVTSGTDPDAECAGVLNCGGGKCQLANGQVCLDGSECVSGNCVDGFCCNGPCSSACQACSTVKKGGGTNGTCGNIAVNTDPDDECVGAASCNGTGACALSPNGTTCNTGDECASGFCVDGVCCNTSCTSACQACTTAKKGSGLNGLCGSIATGTDPDDECSGATVCAPGGCKLPNGEACVSGLACQTGFCVDGVCCDAACNTTCLACIGSKKGGGPDGVCGDIPAGTDPDEECGGPTACTGAGACALLAEGTACTLSAECQSNFCVDGVCCNSACTGTCQACTATKKGSGVTGQCGNIASPTDPDNECAGAASCNGTGACALSPNGAACASSAECTSGFCADGVCCNSGCTSTCQACSALKKGQGSDGTCGSILLGTDPDSECAGAANCSGSTSCSLLGTGVACTQGAECSSTFCVDGVCCSSVCSSACQACTAAKKGNGADGTCANINTGIDPDNECAGTQVCAAGACKLPNGDSCTAATDCVSGFCADGVCCNTACNTSCQACTNAKKGSGVDGTCSTIAAGTDPDNECGGAANCNGSGACGLFANGTACAANAECSSTFCVDGVCCNAACNTSCQACTFAKKGNGTDGTCGNISSGLDPDAECAGAGICNGAAACKLPNAEACTQNTDCLSGFCADGVCCNNACNTTCVACTNAKKGTGADGTCGNITLGTDPDSECFGMFTCSGSGTCSLLPAGAACTVNGECTSNFCVDGVCCNSACNAQCNACTALKKGGGTDGACGAVAAQTDPDSECPGTQVCNSASTCKIPTGEACLLATDCGSGFCVDGVCCNTSCATSCQACTATKKGSGADGVCGTIATATDPDNECFGAISCNGSGACATLAQGTACTANGECASGFCVDGVCCSSACNTLCNACTAVKKGQGADGACGAIIANQDPDAECAGAQVCNGASACRSPNGAACVVAGDCVSNFCADGVCCNAACTGSCQACTATKKGAGADGVCGNIAISTDPDNECFGAISCNGAGACGTQVAGSTCGANGECASGFCVDGVCCNTACNTLCNACTAAKRGTGTDGTCGTIIAGLDPDAECTSAQVCNGASACRLPLGEACVVAADCVSNFCADGVCCNAACTGSCQACTATKKGSGGGADGLCGNIAVSTDPDNECFGAISCNGAGACGTQVAGSTCGANGECASGFCVDGVCCNTACNTLCNACTAVKKGQGADGTCGAVIANADPDSECAGAQVCNGASLCRLPNGEACTLGTDCVSNNCVDGVCCNTTCTGACNACTAAKKGSGPDGVCNVIGVGLDPDNECFAGYSCNGAGACALAANGAACAANAECSSNFCVDGVCCNSACGSLCQACTAVKKNSGADGTCGNIPAANDPDAECPGATLCSGSATCTLFANGAACTINSECTTGNCVDGVCCNNACTGTCNACTAAKKGSGANGTCGVIATNTDPDNECPGATSCDATQMCGLFANGFTCTLDTECGSGNCVDGVCCNVACDGLCEACDGALTMVSDGTCAPVVPGTDPENECSDVSSSPNCGGSLMCGP